MHDNLLDDLPGPSATVLDVSYYLYEARKALSHLPVKLDSNVFFIDLLESSSHLDYCDRAMECVVEQHGQAFIEEHNTLTDEDVQKFVEVACSLVKDLAKFLHCLGFYDLENDEHYLMFDRWISPDIVMLRKGFTDYELGNEYVDGYERPCMFVSNVPWESIDESRMIASLTKTTQFGRGRK